MQRLVSDAADRADTSGAAAGPGAGDQTDRADRRRSTSAGTMRTKMAGRTRRGLLGAGAGLLAAAAIIACASPAQADQLNNALYTHVESTTPVPNSAPDYVSGGAILPVNPGQLGNPFALALSSGQVLGVQNGSTTPGTPVVAQDRTGNPNQIWRFQRVGWIAAKDFTSDSHAWYDGATGHLLGIGEPIFKIINYNSQGGHTCLDGAGAYPGAGAAVTSYTCDPYLMNQTNQLWIVAGASTDRSNTHNEADMTTGFLLDRSRPAYGNDLSYVGPAPYQSLINLSSVIANQGHLPTSLILSSSAQINGLNSPSTLADPTAFDTFRSNSVYQLARVTPPPTQSGGSSNCVGIACIIDFHLYE